jgi:hypothetical protein
MHSMTSLRKAAAGLVAFLAWSAVFALIYTQLPLYASNQNQYFLHGLAHAGYGFLANDWLAQTLDPTPVFSLLIEATYRIFRSELPTYFFYSLLIGVYGYALWGIADSLFHLHTSTLKTLTFITAFLIVHSTGFRFFLSRVWDGESAYVFEGGVAFQRVLGQFFQPSAFGVFLLLSLYLFLIRRRGLSIVALATAIYFHSTYLLAGALITLGYLLAILQEDHSWKNMLRHGLLTLLAMLPILFYALMVFGPTTPELYQQAQNILVHERIPQHAVIIAWLRWTVFAQAMLLAGALWIIRKNRLFPVLAVASAGMLLLTLVEAWTGNDALALLFPWRISVILVPLSSAILLGAFVTFLASRWPIAQRAVRRLCIAGCLCVLSCLIVIGLARSYLDLLSGPTISPALVAYLHAHTTATDVALIPPKMETFRLDSGVPVFVDLKSIPYRDTDVIEWYRRYSLVNSFFAEGADSCALSRQLAQQEGVTIFLMPASASSPGCPGWRIEYRDSDFLLVRLSSVSPNP